MDKNVDKGYTHRLPLDFSKFTHMEKWLKTDVFQLFSKIFPHVFHKLWTVDMENGKMWITFPIPYVDKKNFFLQYMEASKMPENKAFPAFFP